MAIKDVKYITSLRPIDVYDGHDTVVGGPPTF